MITKIRRLISSHSARLPKGTPLLIGLVLSGLLAFLWDHGQTKAASTKSKGATGAPQENMTADTYIPAGYVLVPIQVSNYESLDSILGNFGVVDLFAPAEAPGKKPKRVAERIKILRAPLNPSQFAVLAPEDEAPALVHHEQAFFVVVQNPKRNGTAFVKGPKKHSRSRVLTED